MYYNGWVEAGMLPHTPNCPRRPHPTNSCPAAHVSRAQSESPSLMHGDLRGLNFFFGGWLPPREFSRDSGGNCISFYDPASEVTLHHFGARYWSKQSQTA